MRIRQTHPRLLPQQHWTRLLMLLMALISGILTDAEEIQGHLGGSAFFKFNVTKDMSVTLAEWSRCSDEKVFVFSPIHGLSEFNGSYAGRLSAKSNHGVMLERLQESDFGTYCYKLTTFPNGILQGEIKLVMKIPVPVENGSGLFIAVMISAGCGGGFLLLCGIIAGVVCCKKRRSPTNSALDSGGRTGGQNKAKGKRVQSETEECDDENYLHVP